MVRQSILWPSFAALAFAWAIGFNATAKAQNAALLQAARKDGAVTWYVASLDARNARAAADAFAAKYGPKVRVVSAPSQVLFQRLTQNLAGNANDADVFSSMNVGNVLTLKAQGALAAYVPANAGRLLPTFQHFDEDGTFQATIANLVLIAYNNERVNPADAPKRWTDMLDPKWTGKIVLVHPAFSVQSADWVVQMDKMYGRGFVEKLKHLRPAITRSVSDAVSMLAAGERVLTAAPAAVVLQDAERGTPLSLQYPLDGAILVMTPSAVLKAAPHPNAARLFMEFLLSPDFDRILARAHYAARPSATIGEGSGTSMADHKIIHPTIGQMTAGVPRITSLWRNVFGK